MGTTFTGHSVTCGISAESGDERAVVERQAVAHGEIETHFDELARQMPREIGMPGHFRELALAPAFVCDLVRLATAMANVGMKSRKNEVK